MDPLKVNEITCKTLMGKSGIGPVDYSINPYLGCSHGCVYCYARFMSRRNHKEEEWGTFVDVKVNALDKLRDEITRRRKGLVLLSSVTDPYQPLERQCKLTKGCLEILCEYQYPVEILTKSDLVLRDINLIKEFDSIEVGFTITSFDDNVRQSFEPGSSPIHNRLKAIKKLSDAGISTYTFMGPMLPYISEENIDKLLDFLTSCTNRIMIDRLNIKSGNKGRIMNVVNTHYPDLSTQFENALIKNSGYYQTLKKKMIDKCDRRRIPFDIIY